MDGSTMEASWNDICGVDEIWPNTGVCALVGTTQIAVFRLVSADGEITLVPVHGGGILTFADYALVGDLFEVVPGQTFYERCTTQPSAISRRLSSIVTSTRALWIRRVLVICVLPC